ncbi:MAG: PIN domain-containing protein [Candidatus Riflebacteria bacterium]|nr:PIN domain-containing protein [Candidatus Riflebacteria bacterium]
MSTPLRLFLDACVLVTAANSPEGGSARILNIASEGKVKILATRMVMHEAKVNIIDLLGRSLWVWFYRIVAPLHVSLSDPPGKKEKADWLKITSAEDAHVLAAAIKGKADILISLDRRHILNESVQKAFPIPIMSPGDFLQKYNFTEPKPENHEKKKNQKRLEKK